MIKVELLELDKTFRIQFTSNDIKSDQDTMDQIGALLLGSQPKRGSWAPGDLQHIDILKEE
jgi:hypothetical protein